MDIFKTVLIKWFLKLKYSIDFSFHCLNTKLINYFLSAGPLQVFFIAGKKVFALPPKLYQFGFSSSKVQWTTWHLCKRFIRFFQPTFQSFSDRQGHAFLDFVIKLCISVFTLYRRSMRWLQFICENNLFNFMDRRTSRTQIRRRIINFAARNVNCSWHFGSETRPKNVSPDTSQ